MRSPDGLRRAGRQQLEQAEQRAVMSLCALHENRWPELRLMFHVPNGGKRNPREAAILSGMGVKPGVPDLLLPVARRGFIGLAIEMKRPGAESRTTDAQDWWLRELSLKGWKVSVRSNAEEAWRLITWYVDGISTIFYNSHEYDDGVNRQKMV